MIIRTFSLSIGRTMKVTKSIIVSLVLCAFAQPLWAKDTALNQAEKIFLNQTDHPLQYSNEHLPIIEVPNTLELGKLAALSFLDWVIENPEGVIALPSGKTPEYFIKFLSYYKENWHKPSVKTELHKHGITAHQFPKTSNLKFVQLDEFYGIKSTHQRSFNQYVKNYYVKTLDLKPDNVLLIDIANHGILAKHEFESIFPAGKIDLKLLEHKPANNTQKRQKQALMEAVEYCKLHEDKIREWGGIGFFLGGIGLDGHIAFNLPGVDKNAPTHLTHLNYQTSAQSAIDLGGMEHSRDRGVLTIGLGTLAYNPNAKIIIMAAGEAKAPIIQRVAEGPASNMAPASLLQDFHDVTFYLTHGASKNLNARKAHKFKNNVENIRYATVIETALEHNKPISSLTSKDFENTLPGQALLATQPSLKDLLNQVEQSIKDNIEQGLVSIENKAILHTAPHHDDVMLSYYPLMNQLLHNNNNTFAYLTSGFNSVTDQYLIDAINKIGPISSEEIEQAVIKKSYPALLADFSDAFHQQDNARLEKLESMFVFHKLKEAFWLKNYASFKRKADQIREILIAKAPGDKDIAPIQLIKGMIRESEADRLWAINHVDHQKIKHLRSKFYTGAIFDPIPNIQDDAKPVMKLYERIKPDIITVALDPEGTGPDTHYKVLQVVSQALKLSPSTHAEVWGYRNVWHRFDYQDANIFIPVQYKQLLEQDASFLNAFATQKTAAFPSPAYDGSFSDLSAKIQKSQLDDLKILLGEAYFENHSNALIRNAIGFVLIKRMPKESFVVYADDLKSKMQLDMKMIG